MILFSEKSIGPMQKSCIFFCRELNSLQDGENRIYIEPIVLHTKILEVIFFRKQISQKAAGKVHYTKFHAQIIFISLIIYIEM